MKLSVVLLFVLFSHSHVISGLEQKQNRQRFNSNTDFLFHEAGEVPYSPPKRDYVAPISPLNNQHTNQNWQSTNQKEYDTQFPSLGGHQYTTKPTSTSTYTKPSSKRDYVAPTPTPNKNGLTQSTAKQNYESQFPSLGTRHTTSHTVQPVSSTTSGKRDYVAPHRSTSGPTKESTGKVKDLVNFYDSMNQHPSSGQTSSHVSSTKSGSTTTTRIQNPVTPSPTNVWSNNKNKPISFSDVVAGPNRQGSGTTQKPVSPQGTSSVVKQSTQRPGTPVLPSSLVNNQNNKGNQNPSGDTNNVSDNELQTISEELLRKDTNNAAKFITVNYQGKTTSFSKDDQAPEPLLTVRQEAWNIPTIAKLLPLLDNYERDTSINEHVTPLERNEENAFMDAIMTTSVIRHLMTFLKDKGYVTPDPKDQRDYLKQLWFGLYSRGKGKISSSAFEHIFVSEARNGEVLGLHNWVYFSKEEAANRVNYLGYLKYTQLNDKGVMMKIHFNQQGSDKPVDTMFVGTSPEFEIAIYTLCFATRHDTDCKIKLANKDVDIITHTFRYRSKNYIGSAYPQ